MKSIICFSGFTFELFSGDLISAPSNPYQAHLEWLENHLCCIGEHIKASRIRRMLNVANGYGSHNFIWSDDIYPHKCKIY